MDIDNLILQLRNLITDPESVIFTYPPYRKFHDDLTNYIFVNHLQGQEEWANISLNLVYYSNQRMALEEANYILGQLELLKRKMLTRMYEPLWEYIHPRIKAISQNSYITGEYANAVESAFKEIEVRVRGLYKQKTGVEKSGVALMREAFKFQKDKGTQQITTKPIFVFEEMETQIGQDVQEGYMQLFAGAIQANSCTS